MAYAPRPLLAMYTIRHVLVLSEESVDLTAALSGDGGSRRKRIIMNYLHVLHRMTMAWSNEGPYYSRFQGTWQ
jgi:hypothetical protein